MVFPIRDENHSRQAVPFITLGLILANVWVFVIELLQGPGLNAFLHRYAVVPAEFLHRQDLPPEIPFPYWITLFTAMFLHGGWMHIIANMLYLRIFGDNVEDAMGHGRFLFFYLLCGLAGTFAHIALNPASPTPSLGASGAIAGVLGAYLLLFPNNKVHVLTLYGMAEFPALLVLGFWFVLQLFSGGGALLDRAGSEGGGVAYWAHIGGFVAGLAFAPLLRKPRTRDPRGLIRW